MKLKIQADYQKAKALRKIARISLERLHKSNILNYPSNSLIDYYDILHKLLDAQSLEQGMKIKGEGAHRELIDYICYQQNLPEATRIFLQQLREYRNRISYEGFMIQADFIKRNKERIEKLIKKLSN